MGKPRLLQYTVMLMCQGNPQSHDDEPALQQEMKQPAEESLQHRPSNDDNAASYHDAEPSAEASIQHAQCNDSDDSARNGADQPAEERLEPSQSQECKEAIQQNTEPPVEAAVHQTPKTVGNDSGYNSPEDETSAWEKILEMRAREHQNDLAALQDEHEDELKYLRRDLSSEVGKKELLQRRVKKEVLAKKDIKQQLHVLQGEHRVVVEASKSKDREIEEQQREAVAHRARLQEMETRFQMKESAYLETIKIQEELIKAKEEEVVDLRLRNYYLNSEGSTKSVGADTRKPQEGGLATNGNQWEAGYHHALENGQRWRSELEMCSKQKEQAMTIATNFKVQLELAETANEKLREEVDAKQNEMEVDARYYEQIRGQNWDLQKRINESIGDVATLKYKKALAEQEAAADVKELTRKLDSRTAELSALEATRAEWQADPEGVLLTLSKGVTSDTLILALAKHLELTLNENDSLKQRMVAWEQEYDALNGQLRHTKAHRDGLSQSLAEKASDITCLKDKIHDLETEILRRDMNEEADKRAEPGYLQAMEEIQRLREAASENDESAVDSGLLTAQRDQARRVALQNRQQHVAEVESLKDLIEGLYQRVLKLEATLAAAGRTIEGPDDEGNALKAECACVLGYDEAESELEDGSPVNPASEPENSNLVHAALALGEASNLREPRHDSENVSDEVASPAYNAATTTNLDNSPTNQFESESNDESEVEMEHSSDSSTTIIARRFVMRSLAEGETRIRVLGDPSSPAAPPTPDISTPAVYHTPDSNASTEGDVQGILSDDAGNGNEDGESGDLQLYRMAPLPVASLAWVKKDKPFGYGEPVGDDQFGKEALQA